MWYHWLIFALILVLLPIGVFALRSKALKGKQPNETERNTINLNTVKYIIWGWLCDFFYMVSFNGWLVGQFIFGIAALLMVFCSLTVAFLSDSNKSNKWLLLLDFIVGIAITIYLIYIIPNSNLQSIVTTIIAAVYGGLLTLVGVAWTIKKGDKDRKEDERKKYFPFIKLVDIERNDCEVCAYACEILKRDEDKEAQETDVFYRFQISNFSIKNIAESTIILDSAEVNGKIYPFKEKNLLEKNDRCQLNITGVMSYESWTPFNGLNIIVKDILGNKYKVVCNVEDIDSVEQKTDTPNKNGKIFKYLQSLKKVKTISLPELMQEEK